MKSKIFDGVIKLKREEVKHIIMKSQLSAKAEINNAVLTELLAYDGWLAQQHFPDEEVKMAEDDKRRRGNWAAVVLPD